MQVKVFDESHEKDLENSVNSFLKTVDELIDIKYQVAIAAVGEEQIYCFSAMIIYRKVCEQVMKKNSFITGAMISTISIVAVKIMGMLYVIPFYTIAGEKGGA